MRGRRGVAASELDERGDGSALLGAHPRLQIVIGHGDPGLLDRAPQRFVDGASVVDGGACHVEYGEGDYACSCTRSLSGEPTGRGGKGVLASGEVLSRLKLLPECSALFSMTNDAIVGR